MKTIVANRCCFQTRDFTFSWANMSFISRFGTYESQAPPSVACLGVHAQRLALSAHKLPSIMSTMLEPRTGKNFQAWKDPPVAMKRREQKSCGLIIQSCDSVIQSL